VSPEIFVLLPSRGRPGPLAESVASLRELADDPARIEVLVAVDPDDPDTAQAARDCEAEAWRAPERFGYARLHEYVNALAHQAGGDWMLLWNDDARMRTRGWDSRILEAPPGVLWPNANGYTVENTFPIVHRKVVERIGHVSLSPHYDSWLHAVAEQAGIHHRIAVEVFHDRFDFTGGHDDQTWRETRAQQRTAEFHSPPMVAARRRDAHLLRSAPLV
jgi:glycosyltransferase involved in cell wall biosynthesis